MIVDFRGVENSPPEADLCVIGAGAAGITITRGNDYFNPTLTIVALALRLSDHLKAIA